MNFSANTARITFHGCLAVFLLACAPVETRDVRTDEEIQAVFDRNRSKLFDIYKSFLRKQSDLGGRTLFRITIKASGRVSGCRVEKTEVANPGFGKAICAEIHAFDFGPKNIGTTTISYPLDFYPI